MLACFEPSEVERERERDANMRRKETEGNVAIDFPLTVWCFKLTVFLIFFPDQSNSWSTPQTSLNYSHNTPQRHSDMCAPRQPLSPLYDEPNSPEIYSLHDARPLVSGSTILDPLVVFRPVQPRLISNGAHMHTFSEKIRKIR